MDISAGTDLSLDGVSKRYRIRQQSTQTGNLWHRLRHRLGDVHDFWAVRDVSFDVPHGQALGIIGHNGAGKSTLLKLLSGITAPSDGSMKIRGRIAALLEVGSGFHPELTGRENIFLSGSILGMKRSEIHAKLERIIDFSEVRSFIDTPVKRYSSGMYVRLGFSIAAHLEPDLLLLDEVLAVGDAAFQDKCKERILDLKRGGTTIVFISHDLKAVQNVCDRVIVMQRGRIIHEGLPDDAIRSYIESSTFDRSAMRVRAHTGAIDITGIVFERPDGTQTTHIATGEPLRVLLRYTAARPLAHLQFDVFINDSDGQAQCVLGTRFHQGPVDVPAGPGMIELAVDEFGLRPGIYRLDAVVEQVGAPDPLEWIVGCSHLSVAGGRSLRALFYQPHSVAISHGADVRVSNVESNCR